MMKRLIILTCCILALITPRYGYADEQADYAQAYTLYAAAGACFAAYSDRYGQLANTYLERDGWQIEKFVQAGDVVDARFLVAQKQVEDGSRVYILALVGTETEKDMRANLKAGKVYFAGSTYEEFALYASRKDVPSTEPKVHRGFHEFVQASLRAQAPTAEGSSGFLTEMLLADTDSKIYLVGHSRGGAAAILAGARLISMGVKPEQIEIITFGSPAVGNAAFAERFDPVLNLTRVVVSGDPVTGVLQTLVGGYKQFGRELRWTPPALAENFHDMTIYADLTLKNYFDKREQALKAGLIELPQTAKQAGANGEKVYIAPVKDNLPEPLKQEFRYIKQAVLDEYRKNIPDYEIADDSATDELLRKAADAGCKWLLLSEASGYRMKTKRNVYYLSLGQAVYNVETGELTKAAAFSTGTYHLTPLLAFMHANKDMTYDWLIKRQQPIVSD